MATRLHTTKDGSSTLYSDQYEQYYHNPNGAATESRYVFFERSGLVEALHQAPDTNLSILEIGFGTGLNFLLLLDYLKNRKGKGNVSFYSVEAYPVDPETARSFDFAEHLKHPELTDLLPSFFLDLRPGMNYLDLREEVNAELYLFYGSFKDFHVPSLKVDYIFHDAFSPEVNQELWTDAVFKELYDYANDQAVLSTYCAASKARAAMCASNWYVAKAQGALGKREMTLASPNSDTLSKYKRVNETRLARRYIEGDFD